MVVSLQARAAIAAFEERADEPYLAFEDVDEDLHRRRKL